MCFSSLFHSRSGCHFGSCLWGVRVNVLSHSAGIGLVGFLCGLTETQRSVWRKNRVCFLWIREQMKQNTHVCMFIFPNEIILVITLKLYFTPYLGRVRLHSIEYIDWLVWTVIFLTRLEAGSWWGCLPMWSGLAGTRSGFHVAPFHFMLIAPFLCFLLL